MPSLGGGGEYGGDSPSGGSGGVGGGYGDSYGGGGGSSGSSADINAALDDFFGEIDTASAAMQGKSNAVDKVVNYLMNKVKSIPFVGTAIELAQLAIDVQKDLGVKLSAEQINAVVNGIGRGDNKDTIVRGLRNDLGIETPKTKENDPKSNEFWEQFVNEWKDAKANIKANDQFRKDKMQPAFETYRQRLSGLSNEPTFAPINVKFGDFQTSFNTQRSAANAQNILNSELAETDIMQPKRAEQDYMGQLMGLAQWQQEMKNKINLTKTQERPDDQGSWLDIINDTIKVGKSGAELWDMFSK